MEYFIYILECTNNAFYTGYTTDIVRRYQEHQQGLAKCKYTRSFPPKRIAACWKIEAGFAVILSIERMIKKLSKPEKIALVNAPEKLGLLLTGHRHNDFTIREVLAYARTSH
jgi:putative endonuclease